IQMSKEWPNLPEFALTVAMLLGGCACSTAGGFKALRVAITAKLFSREVKKTIYPRRAIIVEKYHHLTDTVLRDDYARGALLVIVGYIILFTFGTIVGMFYDYNAIDSMFESSSAVANAGLSAGITSPTMPAMLKITYIFIMWAGRLEILSVFTLFGMMYIGLRKLQHRYQT
ncbi:MAG: potassium transporter TrkG, partial [Candidatus Altiarchaeota archaeon]